MQRLLKNGLLVGIVFGTMHLSTLQGAGVAPVPVDPWNASLFTCEYWNALHEVAVSQQNRLNYWSGWEAGYTTAVVAILPDRLPRRITVGELMVAITNRCATHPSEILVSVARWALGGPEP